MEWLVRWQGMGPVEDQWRDYTDINTGGMCEPWSEYERARQAENLMRDQAHGVGLGHDCAEINEIDEIDEIDADCEINTSYENSMATLDQSGVGQLLQAQQNWSNPNRPLKVLVLFSGTGSVEGALHRYFPQAMTVSVDCEPKFQPTHCCTVQQWINMEGGLEMYDPHYFDVIWASPPCTEYSRAKSTGPPVAGALDPRFPHRDYVVADDNVRAARYIIDKMQPRYWFIENPDGYLTTRPIMQDITHLRRDCTYCMYGTSYRKSTHIWTNAVLRQPLRRCTSTTPCNYTQTTGRHPVTAQSGPSANAKGSGSAVAVYPIPPGLIKALTQDLVYGAIEDPLPAYLLTSIIEEFKTLDETDADCNILCFGVQPSTNGRYQRVPELEK
jgi:hypothetical protein